MSLNSETDIANAACDEVGAKGIASLNDKTTTGRWFRRNYARTRDRVLAEHEWNEAQKRVNLAKKTTPPLFEWANAFQLPSDLITFNRERYIGVCFEIEGDLVLTDEARFQLVYTYRLEDVTLMSDLLKEAIVSKLAASMTGRFKPSAQRKAQLLDEYQNALGRAMTRDAQQGPRRTVVASQLLDARRSDNTSRSLFLRSVVTP